MGKKMTKKRALVLLHQLKLAQSLCEAIRSQLVDSGSTDGLYHLRIAKFQLSKIGLPDDFPQVVDPDGEVSFFDDLSTIDFKNEILPDVQSIEPDGCELATPFLVAFSNRMEGQLQERWVCVRTEVEDSFTLDHLFGSEVDGFLENGKLVARVLRDEIVFKLEELNAQKNKK